MTGLSRCFRCVFVTLSLSGGGVFFGDRHDVIRIVSWWVVKYIDICPDACSSTVGTFMRTGTMYLDFFLLRVFSIACLGGMCFDAHTTVTWISHTTVTCTRVEHKVCQQLA